MTKSVYQIFCPSMNVYKLFLKNHEPYTSLSVNLSHYVFFELQKYMMYRQHYKVLSTAEHHRMLTTDTYL